MPLLNLNVKVGIVVVYGRLKSILRFQTVPQKFRDGKCSTSQILYIARLP